MAAGGKLRRSGMAKVVARVMARVMARGYGTS